jgi:acyl-coenzyme A thioesterase PaaI-like protein
MVNPSKALHWKAHCDANPITRETIEHFAANPSMSRYLQDGDYESIPTFCRVMKPDGEDAFFAKTISSPATIPHFLTLLRRGLGLSPTANTDGKSAAAPDTIGLVTFGGRDLVGHPTVVHGGVSTALLDESMSFLLHMYQVRIAGDTPRNSLFTVNLNINFRAAVPAPGEVVIECRVLKVDGRKYFVRGVMKDTAGKVLVDAEGLWLSMRAANL